MPPWSHVTDGDDTRTRLEALRTELRERIDALAEPPELGASQGFGKRIGDGTVEAIRRLTDIGVGSSFEERLERVDRALEKLDEGSYGTCDACCEPIPQPRMQAMPESVLCVTCAGAQRRAPRPRR
jgi:RNA polymerase-binding transcription factor